MALVSDANSQDVARKVRQIFIDRTGKTPHLIVNQLHRSRMDANRDLEDGAQGSSIARTAHREYHAAIQRAKASLGRSPGLLLDFHMQGHGKETTELGYVYLKSQLNAGHLERLGPVSSVSSLIARTGLTPQEMISGEFSLGAMWEEAGYKAVPSPRQPRPGTDLYYRGGYTVQTHGSSHGGKVDAIQLEMPKELLERASVRNRFANKVGEIVTIFHTTYYT